MFFSWCEGGGGGAGAGERGYMLTYPVRGPKQIKSPRDIRKILRLVKYSYIVYKFSLAHDQWHAMRMNWGRTEYYSQLLTNV